MGKILEAIIFSGKLQGEVVLLPQIPMIPSDSPTLSNVCNFQFACTPQGGTTAYQLLHCSINRQAANRVIIKNDANLALSPTFRRDKKMHTHFDEEERIYYHKYSFLSGLTVQGGRWPSHEAFSSRAFFLLVFSNT
ncbi:hypothetical protein TNCV_558991 [Trichonephila clavipes]|nr:hypothetical protein TNCV_558991 [Trichonephila clavipes]